MDHGTKVMMGEEDLQHVCRELNQLTIRTLELMQDYIRCKAKIEKRMQFGFINIAKARYIMGNHTITSLQLPNENSTEFDALTTVTLSTDENDGRQRFALNASSSTNVEDGKSTAVKDETVRKRTKDEKTDTDASDKETNIASTNNTVDPMKWFGVLVPRNLRQAQYGFKSVVELAAESASIQLELETTRNKCKQLKEKRAVLKKNCDAD